MRPNAVLMTVAPVLVAGLAFAQTTEERHEMGIDLNSGSANNWSSAFMSDQKDLAISATAPAKP